jgi:hypothetical protein
MATFIKLADGDSVTVREDYRDVYEKLLAGAWQQPCEFTSAEPGVGAGEIHRLTVNPAYIVFVRGT